MPSCTEVHPSSSLPCAIRACRSVTLHSSYQLVNWLRTGRLDSAPASRVPTSDGKHDSDVQMSMNRLASHKVVQATDAPAADVRMMSSGPDKV